MGLNDREITDQGTIANLARNPLRAGRPRGNGGRYYTDLEILETRRQIAREVLNDLWNRPPVEALSVSELLEIVALRLREK